MNKKNSIPVNFFRKESELEWHVFVNSFPLFMFIALGVISYSVFSSIKVLVISSLIGLLWAMLFVAFTYLYSNARLYVTENELILKKGKEEKIFKWENIQELKYVRMSGGREPTIPPIEMIIVAQNDIVVYLYKNKFRTPIFIYYKFTSLIACVPQARKFLPDNLDELL